MQQRPADQVRTQSTCSIALSGRSGHHNSAFAFASDVITVLRVTPATNDLDIIMTSLFYLLTIVHLTARRQMTP